MLKKSMFLTVILGFILIASCGKDEPICSTTGVTYTNTIKSILDASCAKAGCHVTGSPVGDMSDYDKTKAYFGVQKVVKAIKREAGVSPMPKTGDKLSDCQISQVEAWIAAGLPK
jgi:mono/diheme cytochrome c family protein